MWSPIMDDYSEPSFIKCTFDTDSKDVTLVCLRFLMTLGMVFV